jgi:inositol 1,4,5-triphosphate receptor type 1/inositol 1,4,5-triphosphate receptor type 3
MPNITLTYGWGRFFFDETSNIIGGIIMLNIVGGIIIDTFSSLREEENAKNEDKLDKCFICGNLQYIHHYTYHFRTTFERSQSGFQQHIKMNHYMWNYLFFIAYLQNKDETEFSGTESFVFSKLEEDDLCWIPFNQARELM